MIKFDYNTRLLSINTPYNADFIEKIKGIQTSRFNPNKKNWQVYPIPTNINHLLEIAKKFNFYEELEGILSDILSNGDLLDLPDKIDLSALKTEIEKYRFKIKLRPYQIEGIANMLNWKRCFNADDMGLGKTAQAICAVEIYKLFPCLVVTPNSVKYNWVKEWNKWVDDRKIFVIESGVKTIPTNCDVYIINYDSLASKSGKRVTPKFPILKETNWQSIIVDESQYVKNATSNRSKALLKIVDDVEFRFLLSGTAVMNRPSELINQLVVLGQFNNLFQNWKKFVENYCDAKEGQFGYDIKGASNLDELHYLLRLNCYVRREKWQVLQDLPSRTENIVECGLSNFGEYSLAENDYIRFVNDNMDGKESLLRAQFITRLTILKKLSITGKLSFISEWLKTWRESTDEKLVIFGVHREPLEKLSKEFCCDCIIGGVKAKDRLDIVEKWKTNKKQFLFGNIESLGVGVDGLQECSSNCVFIELPDRPADIEQAISRVERSGQKNNIGVYFIIADKSIDITLQQTLLEKKEIVDAVVIGQQFLKREIVCYTDGSCYYKSGLGGSGCYMIIDGKETFLRKGFKNTKTGRTEIHAVLLALRNIEDKSRRVKILSDSAYVVNAVNEGIWKWFSEGKQDIANRDLWIQMVDELELFIDNGGDVRLQHIKGHVGHFGNEVADLLAEFKTQEVYVDDGIYNDYK